MVIDGHDNKEKKIEIGIPQELLVSLILFLIYISRVFNAVRENNLAVTSLSFMDHLRFIAFCTSIKEIFQTLDILASVYSSTLG